MREVRDDASPLIFISVGAKCNYGSKDAELSSFKPLMIFNVQPKNFRKTDRLLRRDCAALQLVKRDGELLE